MKIYFDGCSWTWGSELENNEEERYPKLICDHLGAEEINFSMCGGSNDRIVRNLLVENDIEKYDVAFIQMTYSARTEYLKVARWEEDKWTRVSVRKRFENWLREDSEKDYSLLGDKEYYDTALSKFDSERKKLVADDITKFWRYYYTRVANIKYFQTKEKIHLETIRNTCKAKGVPLVLSTINTYSNLDFDYVMKVKKVTSAPKGHPNKLGHQIIANDLLKHYENLL